MPLASCGVPPSKMPTEFPLTPISPAVVPVPSILILKLGLSGSLLAIVIVPVSSAAAAGTNFTWNVSEAPGASEPVTGGFTKEKPVPASTIDEIDNVFPPVLVSVKVSITLPVVTTASPKLVPLAVLAAALLAMLVPFSVTESD